jgi:hypothetical protein
VNEFVEIHMKEMMKKLFMQRPLSSLFVLIMIMSSCEVAEEILGGNVIITKLEGSWMCDEDNGKRKSVMEIYEVEISADPNNENGILIYNIYGLGVGIYAKADVNGKTISINDDVTGGFHILATGNISSDFENINWTFSVDDGSGVPENFTAVYTKID